MRFRGSGAGLGDRAHVGVGVRVWPWVWGPHTGCGWAPGAWGLWNVHGFSGHSLSMVTDTMPAEASYQLAQQAQQALGSCDN